jgi:hypothetical protein
MSSHHHVTRGELIAYEFSDGDKWLWSVGRVLDIPHPRLMTLQMWFPQKRNDISEDERKAIQSMLDGILEKQKSLGAQKTDFQRMGTEMQIKAEEIGERRRQCEAELGEVLPALEEAKKLVSGISVKELREIKTYTTPPQTVKLVMEAVLTVLGEGKKASDWEYVKQYITDVGFISKVKAFDPLEMSNDSYQRASQVAKQPDFTFDRANRASKAAGPLQKWVVAQLSFFSAVPPRLRPRLEEARKLKAELAALEDSLRVVDASINAIENELHALHRSHNELVYGGAVDVFYDRDGAVCVTRTQPGGSWVPATDRKKLTTIKSAALCCLLDRSSSESAYSFTFTPETIEAVKQCVNVHGHKVIADEAITPQAALDNAKHHLKHKKRAVEDAVIAAQRISKQPHPPASSADPAGDRGSRGSRDFQGRPSLVANDEKVPGKKSKKGVSTPSVEEGPKESSISQHPSSHSLHSKDSQSDDIKTLVPKLPSDIRGAVLGDSFEEAPPAATGSTSRRKLDVDANVGQGPKSAQTRPGAGAVVQPPPARLAPIPTGASPRGEGKGTADGASRSASSSPRGPIIKGADSEAPSPIPVSNPALGKQVTSLPTLLPAPKPKKPSLPPV